MLYLTIDVRPDEATWSSTNRKHIHQQHISQATKSTRGYIARMQSVEVPGLSSPSFALAVVTTGRRPSGWDLLKLQRAIGIIFASHFLPARSN